MVASFISSSGPLKPLRQSGMPSLHLPRLHLLPIISHKIPSSKTQEEEEELEELKGLEGLEALRSIWARYLSILALFHRDKVQPLSLLSPRCFSKLLG